MLARGSIQDEGSLWYVIDLERARAGSILARRERDSGKLVPARQSNRPLSPPDRSRLERIAGRIWSNPAALPTNMATDVVWDLWLFDGGDVRHEGGPGTPDGLAADLEAMAARLTAPEASGQ